MDYVDGWCKGVFLIVIDHQKQGTSNTSKGISSHGKYFLVIMSVFLAQISSSTKTRYMITGGSIVICHGLYSFRLYSHKKPVIYTLFIALQWHIKFLQLLLRRKLRLPS